MKIGITLGSFNLCKESLGTIGIFDKAKELGIDTIDLETIREGFDEETFALARKYREHMEKIGLEPGAYLVVAKMTADDIEAEIQRVCRTIDVANEMGFKLVRMDVCGGFSPARKLKRDYDSFLEIGAEPIRKIADYAQSLGIMLSTENHGKFSQDPERIEKLINTVNHPNFMALVDIGNFLCVDYDPARAVGIVAPYAVHVHAKDFVFHSGELDTPGNYDIDRWFQTRGGNFIKGTIFGQGIVPVKSCLRTLKTAGYDGVIAIEYEGREEPIYGISKSIYNLKRFLSEI